jgi:hypothetical protein
MFFLWLCIITTAISGNPNASLTVYARSSNDIYIADPVINGDMDKEIIKSAVQTYSSMHHRAFYRNGSIGSVYDEETLKFLYPTEGCNFKKTPLQCASNDGFWTLMTYVNKDKERAAIRILLYDDNGEIIGQSSVVNKKKTIIIKNKKVTNTQKQGQGYSAAGSINNCKGGSCKIPSRNQARGQQQRGSYSGPGPVLNQRIEEDLKPTIIHVPPEIGDRDIQQAIMMLYLSIH